VNPTKTIKNLKGEEYPKSFPSSKELEAIKNDTSKLERETIGNVILNCLTNYVVQDRKEGFYINLIAQSLLSNNEKIEFKDKIQKFLIDVLNEQTLIRKKVKDEKGEEKEEIKGLYQGWVISQVLQELGVKPK